MKQKANENLNTGLSVLYSGDLNSELVWYSDHEDLFVGWKEMPGTMVVWFSDHHLVNRLVFRPLFDYVFLFSNTYPDSHHSQEVWNLPHKFPLYLIQMFLLFRCLLFGSPQYSGHGLNNRPFSYTVIQIATLKCWYYKRCG